jgi:hypothetical protein
MDTLTFDFHFPSFYASKQLTKSTSLSFSPLHPFPIFHRSIPPADYAVGDNRYDSSFPSFRLAEKPLPLTHPCLPYHNILASRSRSPFHNLQFLGLALVTSTPSKQKKRGTVSNKQMPIPVTLCRESHLMITFVQSC